MSEDRDFRSWQVTPEQADRIAYGDREEAIVFYALHKKRFERMALNYAQSHNVGKQSHFYDVEEMTSQLLLDLPFLNWKNAITLTMSIKQRSFAWSAYGGYAQRVEAGLPHSRDPWFYLPEIESIDAPMFEEDKDGASLLDRFVATPEEESPLGILLANEGCKPLEADEIVRRLTKILSPMESEFLKLYLDGLSFTQISEALGRRDCTILKEQTLSKLIRRYREVIDLVSTDGISRFKELVPDNFEILDEAYRERLAKKRKGEKPKRVFASDAERQEAEKESKRKWYEKNRELQNERRRARRQAEREARKARASV